MTTPGEVHEALSPEERAELVARVSASHLIDPMRARIAPTSSSIRARVVAWGMEQDREAGFFS